MDIKEAFASALKQARHTHGLTQEDFSNVSSRTYVSTLERGLKNPTLDKIDVLAKTIGIHPLTLVTLTYMNVRNESNTSELFRLVSEEIKHLLV